MAPTLDPELIAHPPNRRVLPSQQQARMRDELLNETLFLSLAHARVEIAETRVRYGYRRIYVLLQREG